MVLGALTVLVVLAAVVLVEGPITELSILVAAAAAAQLVETAALAAQVS